MDVLKVFIDEVERICVQYTMPSISQHNGVVERWNHTLMDTVRSTLNYSTMHALKTSTYLLNRVPSKGCLAKVKVYNPHEKKFDARTIY
ncbi:hypothetical protein CR513_28632, partial [Mucuna pruriens]